MRTRLNEISGISELTPEIREEAATLESEYADLEIRHRSAIISEGKEEDQALGMFPDGSTDSDGAELRSLLGRVSLADYLSPAIAGVGCFYDFQIEFLGSGSCLAGLGGLGCWWWVFE